MMENEIDTKGIMGFLVCLGPWESTQVIPGGWLAKVSPHLRLKKEFQGYSAKGCSKRHGAGLRFRSRGFRV